MGLAFSCSSACPEPSLGHCLCRAICRMAWRWASASLYRSSSAAASADAFRTARRLYSVDSESMRGPAQRAYFPVFLTTLVPGLGQLHERRWRSRIGFLFLSLYLWLVPVSFASLVGKAGVLILRSLACAHALLMSTREKDNRAWRAAWLLAGVVAATLVGSYTLRAARRSFLVENLIWNGNSMMPTVPHGSRCIADMMTYRYRDPEIGDIILFTLPKSAVDKGKDRQIRLSRIVHAEERPCESGTALSLSMESIGSLLPKDGFTRSSLQKW